MIVGHSPATLQQYYANADVRRRIREYCGDSGDGVSTAVYLAAMTEHGAQPEQIHVTVDLQQAGDTGDFIPGQVNLRLDDIDAGAFLDDVGIKERFVADHARER